MATLLLLSGPLALQAQGPEGGGMGGRGGGHHGEYGRPDELDGLVLDPVVWNGPPSADSLPAGIQLNADQRPRYDSLFTTFMPVTKRVRDQATTNRQVAFGGQPHTGGLPPATVGDLKEESLYLSQKQDVFDAAIETFLTRDQLKEYHKWRKAQRKAAEKEADKRHEAMRGRGSPPY